MTFTYLGLIDMPLAPLASVFAIGAPILCLALAVLYLFQGIRALIRGEFIGKDFRYTRNENPTEFRLTVGIRLTAGFLFFLIIMAICYLMFTS